MPASGSWSRSAFSSASYSAIRTLVMIALLVIRRVKSSLIAHSSSVSIVRAVRRAWFAATVLFAACIHVAPRPIDPAASARALEQRSLADGGVQAFVAAHSQASAPIARWDLQALTLAALYFHPDLDVA